MIEELESPMFTKVCYYCCECDACGDRLAETLPKKWIIKYARALGWTIRRDGKMICPTCRKVGQTPENPFAKYGGSTEFISAEYKETLKALKIREEFEANVGWQYR